MIIGTKYNDWEVISEETQKYKRWYKYHVKCKCGKEDFISSQSLKSGTSTKCRKCSTDEKYKGYKCISSSFFSRIIESSIKRNIEFNITIEYIYDLLEKQDFKCALSNIHITMSKHYAVDRGNKISKTTASLDRIDSSKGYIENNVQWVHKDINIMKNKFNNNYFIEICKLITNNN